MIIFMHFTLIQPPGANQSGCLPTLIDILSELRNRADPGFTVSKSIIFINKVIKKRKKKYQNSLTFCRRKGAVGQFINSCQLTTPILSYICVHLLI